jgi:Kinesin motor domain
LFLASSGKVTLTNPEDNSEKDYFYDYSFWSHDNKQGRKLFTNSDLYDKIGTELLNNAYSGFNSTVFAYGQTGSGKSYSIEGSKDDKGLLQRVCEALFDKKTEIEKKEGNSLDCHVSYLEIYNEELRDLLDCTEKELKIFQLNNTVFVKNLSRIFCDDFGDISKLLYLVHYMKNIRSKDK